MVIPKNLAKILILKRSCIKLSMMGPKRGQCYGLNWSFLNLFLTSFAVEFPRELLSVPTSNVYHITFRSGANFCPAVSGLTWLYVLARSALTSASFPALFHFNHCSWQSWLVFLSTQGLAGYLLRAASAHEMWSLKVTCTLPVASTFDYFASLN